MIVGSGKLGTGRLGLPENLKGAWHHGKTQVPLFLLRVLGEKRGREKSEGLQPLSSGLEPRRPAKIGLTSVPGSWEAPSK